MFINRPLIHGIVKKPQNTNQSSKRDTKSNMRIKTVPSKSKNVKQTSRTYKDLTKSNLNDFNNLQNAIIGIKDIKQMIDNDLDSLIQKILILQDDTQQQYKKYTTKYQKFFKLRKIQSNETIQEYSLKQEEKAYLQCKQVLQYKNQQEQNVHSKFLKQKTIQFYEIQQTMIEMQNLKNSILQQNNKLRFQAAKMQQQNKLIAKKIIGRRLLKEEIKKQMIEMKKMNQKVHFSKQESIKQKNRFIEIQAEQLRIIKQLQYFTAEEQQYKDYSQQHAYYIKLQKLRSKLLSLRSKDTSQVQDFIEQKIQKISKILAQNDNRVQSIQQLCAKIQQQQAIIQMLSKKYNQQDELNQPEFDLNQDKYIKHYNQIYLNKNNYSRQNIPVQTEQQHIKHWEKYKVYLQKILKNQKRLKQSPAKSYSDTSLDMSNQDIFPNQFNKQYDQLTQSPFKKQKIQHFNSQNLIKSSGNKTDFKQAPYYGKQEPYYDRKVSVDKNKKYQQLRNKQKTNLLPKLIKMEGRLQDQNKIKHQLTKFTNQKFDEDVELETVRTSQAGQDEIIEVQFKGTKKKQIPMLYLDKKSKLKTQLNNKNSIKGK